MKSRDFTWKYDTFTQYTILIVICCAWQSTDLNSFEVDNYDLFLFSVPLLMKLAADCNHFNMKKSFNKLTDRWNLKQKYQINAFHSYLLVLIIKYGRRWSLAFVSISCPDFRMDKWKTSRVCFMQTQEGHDEIVNVPSEIVYMMNIRILWQP